jgi:hypothetical protein
MMHVEFDGKDVTGPITVPKTGGWSNWTTVTVEGVALKAGRQAMRVVFDSDGSDFGSSTASEFISGVFVCNLNWIELRRSAK